MHPRSSRLALFAVLAWLMPVRRAGAVSAKQPTGCTSGTGLVFNPNPVVTSGNTNLTDRMTRITPRSTASASGCR